ncbi:sugar transferase [Cupriavidus sp. KB_39]|jgi:exopolysaccharide biosynthesis polyprenyl glycosylphosphotransferase|uniref:sugar transferase n=1 Tax=Cupriavidus sp. KB_39 TaxID=3233036 RepID=UPI003F90C8ED
MTKINSVSRSNEVVRARGSETMRRASRMMGWALLGLFLLGLSILAVESLRQTGVVTVLFTRTLAWSGVAYLCAFALMLRSLHLPAVEGNSLVGLSVTLAFVILLAGFAVLRVEYSRVALVISYFATLVWTWSGYRLFVRNYVPVFGYSDEGTLAQLEKILNMPGAAPPSANRFEHIRSLFEATRCDALMVDRNATADPERTRLLSQLKLSHVRMYSVERIGEMLTGRVGLAHIDENFLDDYAKHYFYGFFKRLLDIVAVIVLSPLALPLSVLVGLAVRLESKGPAIFRQTRVGVFGRAFVMLKFRSMTTDDDAPAQFAKRQDPRVTRVGRVIRKYRLDEIPQLWNVLKGDMSLIGPRPEQVPMVDQFSQSIPYYPYRHLVRPGLSGWAQVQQGYVGTHEETVTKLSYDLYYVKHCSFALDFLIALKTLRTLLTGYGAR